ncbi:hypothetical protein ASNO1_52950 [Corallococcus caeni]|uniref:Uncharacterized protein n=1 Tax=Corallococcus caeni TaxID=3082388 RepID=A0ABQ6QYD4_9BACT|nr:hypothetical protein ASNO1_52950 [Corallococcus sp. NO1]
MDPIPTQAGCHGALAETFPRNGGSQPWRSVSPASGCVSTERDGGPRASPVLGAPLPRAHPAPGLLRSEREPPPDASPKGGP